MNGSQSAKDLVRRRLSSLRRNLLPEEVSHLSQQITASFLTHPHFQLLKNKQMRVGLYRALLSEVNLHGLAHELLKLGWKVHYPRVNEKTEVLEFVEYRNEMNDLFWKKGKYNFEEPHLNFPAVSSDCLDILFIPGVAFDQTGARIGRGGGHYDRFVVKISGALRIALSYDFQILEKIEQDPWDQSVHWIITEKREFASPFVLSWFKNRKLL